jgi:hypothetical protein
MVETTKIGPHTGRNSRTSLWTVGYWFSVNKKAGVNRQNKPSKTMCLLVSAPTTVAVSLHTVDRDLEICAVSVASTSTP